VRSIVSPVATACRQGHAAERVLGNVKAHINRVGGSPANIDQAVARLTQAGDADRMMYRVATASVAERFGHTPVRGNLMRAPRDHAPSSIQLPNAN